MVTKVLKDRLMEKIEKLPEDRLREALDFVEYLRAKGRNETVTRLSEDLDPQDDPILKLVGIADVQAFSQNIDEHLYGE